MKILQFNCSTGFYGAERWVLALARHLPDDVKSELAVTLEPGTEDLQLVREFMALGKTHQIPMNHKFDISVVDRLCKMIKDNDIDIIHTHGYKSDIIGVWAARKAGIPCVVTPHGFENAADIKLRLFIWAGCKAMKYADKVVPLSKQLLADVKKFNVPQDKLAYIQNGVNLSEVETVRLTKHERPASSIKTIGFVGQMISRKNIQALLRVFDRLYQQRQDIQLVFVGDGDSRPELETFAAQLPSNQAIQFLGFRNDRLQQLRDFDLFVMSSTLEGIPRCLMEACAMAIPVSAFDIPGIDQLITHKETGLLAPLHDEEQLLNDWQVLLDDTDYATGLANNAKRFVEKHFSAQRMADEYYDLFKSLVKG